MFSLCGAGVGRAANAFSKCIGNEQAKEVCGARGREGVSEGGMRRQVCVLFLSREELGAFLPKAEVAAAKGGVGGASPFLLRPLASNKSETGSGFAPLPGRGRRRRWA